MMTIGGTGFITVAWNLRCVSTTVIMTSPKTYYSTHLFIAMYRSKDSTFPDFSKGNDVVGELFFNVRSILIHTSCASLISYPSQMPSQRMELLLSSSTSSRNAENTSDMQSLFLSVLIFHCSEITSKLWKFSLSGKRFRNHLCSLYGFPPHKKWRWPWFGSSSGWTEVH